MNFSIMKNKAFKALVLVILVLGLIYYLLNVFWSAHICSTNYLRMEPKPGHTRPEVSAECRKILADADLQPYGGRPRPIEFREYGNIWAWDNAKTLMYKSTVMNHPECFNVLMKRLVATNMRYILVIYDCEKKSEVLIIRNYK